MADNEETVEATSTKRRTKRIVDINSLASKPSIRKFLKVEGDKAMFTAGKKSESKSVNRCTSSAVSRLDTLAKMDNRYARQIAKIAILVAASSKKRTVTVEHLSYAEAIYESTKKHLNE